MKKNLIVSGIIVLGVVAAVLVLKPGGAGDPDGFSSGDRIRTKGPEDARIQIVEYSDFQCPACARAQVPLKSILQDHPNDVHLTFRHYPLPGHLWAMHAHLAAECAAEQDKFWSFHDRLFAEQKDWSGPANPTEKFVRYAKTEGLDLDAFGVCLSKERAKDRVLKDKAGGDTALVRSTPTFFINGERFVGQFQLNVKGRDLIRKTLGLPPLVREKQETPVAGQT